MASDDRRDRSLSSVPACPFNNGGAPLALQLSRTTAILPPSTSPNRHMSGWVVSLSFSATTINTVLRRSTRIAVANARGFPRIGKTSLQQQNGVSMFLKSTSAFVTCCVMMVVVALTQQPAMAGQQHSRRHHQIISCRALNANAAITLSYSGSELSRYSNAIESAPAGH
jgi:hypothetical protein